MSVNYYEYYINTDGVNLDTVIMKTTGFKEAQESIDRVYEFVEPRLKTKEEKMEFDDIMSNCVTRMGEPWFNLAPLYEIKAEKLLNLLIMVFSKPLFVCPKFLLPSIYSVSKHQTFAFVFHSFLIKKFEV